jgi:glycerophosphoryl diester phosphodiesterase
VLVLIHDQTLNRTARGSESNCAGLVADKTIAQLKTCDVGSWFNPVHPFSPFPEFVGLRIPTLEEVLSRYGSTGRFYIETKNPEMYPGIETGIIGLLNKYGIVAGSPPKPRVFIQSFSAASLLRVHAIDPAMPVVQLLGAVTPAGLVAQLDPVRSYATGIGPIKSDVTAAVVEAAHGKCILVHPYTVDDDDEMLSLLAMGVDGMFTNRPDRLREMINRTPVRTVGVTGCIAVTH